MDISWITESNHELRDDTLISEPVSYDASCAEIPEKEDTAFMAVRLNDLATLERRLHEGVDINTKHVEETGDIVYTIKDLSRMVRQLRLKQYSLLHVAVVHGTMETIQSVLSYGACVNITDQNHMSPLSLATAIQRSDVVKLLIEEGADVNIQSVSGRTPLILAVENNSLSTVRLLIGAGADLDLADMKGTTPLFSFISLFSYMTASTAASRRGNLNILRALVEGGCTVNLPNKQGATPLMTAIGMGRIDAAEVLLEAGANINLVDKAGKSLCHMAAGVRTALFLINNGAPCDLPDKQGVRPIDRAAHVGHIGMLRLLLGCDCHRTTTILDIPSVVQSRRNLPIFDRWLQQELYNPRELKRLCRQTIRQCLSPNNMTSIEELPVPRLMKDYLLAKHLDLTFDSVALDNVINAVPVSLEIGGRRFPR